MNFCLFVAPLISDPLLCVELPSYGTYRLTQQTKHHRVLFSASFEGREGCRFAVWEETDRTILAYAEQDQLSRQTLAEIAETQRFDLINGFFWLILIDHLSGQVSVVNDRFSSKEIYYCDYQGGVLIYTDYRSSFTLRDKECKINLLALKEYLKNGYVSAPHTILCGISKLECGSVLTVQEKGLHKCRYYSFAAEYEQQHGTVMPSYEEVLRLFEQYTDVSMQNLKSSSDAVVLLSSGVDSAYLAVKAKDIYDQVTALTIGQRVGDPRYDEGEAAKTVAAMIDLPQSLQIVELSEIEHRIDDLLTIYPELFGDTAQLAVYRMAQNGDTQVDYICGEGPDSLFCWMEGRVLPDNSKDFLLSNLLVSSVNEEFDSISLSRCQREWEQIMQALVHKTTAVFDYFHLTVKFPYLNHSLISLCFGLPKEYLNSAEKKKRILRSLLNEKIPYDSLHLPKRGAGVPAYLMLKTTGKAELLRLSQTEFLSAQGIFDVDGIQCLLDHFFEDTLLYGVKTHGLVWRFYLFQKWYERYIQ